MLIQYIKRKRQAGKNKGIKDIIKVYEETLVSF
jgi:hypothetical protein